MAKAKAKTKNTTRPDGPEADKDFMADPMNWPNWPVLPVKRRPPTASIECGVLIAVEGHLTTVFVANMFDLGGTNLRESLIENEKVKRYFYSDFDALVLDGWVVD